MATVVVAAKKKAWRSAPVWVMTALCPSAVHWSHASLLCFLCRDSAWLTRGGNVAAAAVFLCWYVRGREQGYADGEAGAARQRMVYMEPPAPKFKMASGSLPAEPLAPPSSSFGIGKLMTMGFLGKQLYDLGGRPFRSCEAGSHAPPVALVWTACAPAARLAFASSPDSACHVLTAPFGHFPLNLLAVWETWFGTRRT